MGLEYGREKLWLAVDTLATTDGSIQQRLAWAAMDLTTLRLGDSNLAEEHRSEFDAIWHELTKEEATGGEGTIIATANKLNRDQAQALARRIFSLYDKSARRDLKDGNESPRPRALGQK